MLTEISTQKTSPNILKHKRPEPIGVRVPQHNNHAQKVTVIHGFKNKLNINPLATTNAGNKVVSGPKSGNVSSGITITPVPVPVAIGVGTGNHVNHVKLNPSKQITIAAATHMIPKTNSSMKISSTKIDTATLASSTTSMSASNSKDDAHKSSVMRPVKRIQPTKISETVNIRSSSIEKSSDSDVMSLDSFSVTNDETVKSHKSSNETNHLKRPSPGGSTDKAVPSKRANLSQNRNTPLTAAYRELIDACKAMETSQTDMKKIAEKLERYYHRAHPEYVNSHDFCELVKDVTHHVKTQPSRMYFKLIDLLQELKTRQQTKINGNGDSSNALVAAPAPTTPAIVDPKEQKKEKKRARLIQKLNDTLQRTHQKIQEYEQAEVNWDDENNSSFIIADKLKERAYEIYLELCKLTGENQNIERTVKKVKFNGTKFKEFNKMLEKFVNEKTDFPDMFDVLRILDHCTKKYGYHLDKQTRHSVGECTFFF